MEQWAQGYSFPQLRARCSLTDTPAPCASTGLSKSGPRLTVVFLIFSVLAQGGGGGVSQFFAWLYPLSIFFQCLTSVSEKHEQCISNAACALRLHCSLMDYIYIAMLDIALRHSMKQKSHAIVPTKCKHGSSLNAELFFFIFVDVGVYLCLPGSMDERASNTAVERLDFHETRPNDAVVKMTSGLQHIQSSPNV